MNQRQSGDRLQGEIKVILAGLGGQGILFLTRLLAQTAAALGQPVMVSETHGMSQRGGSVVSHLKINAGAAPLIRHGTAELLLALERDEATRNFTFLRPGSVAFVNAEVRLPQQVWGCLTRLDIGVCLLPATRIAMALGSPAVTNMVLLGFAAAHPALPLPLEAIKVTLLDMTVRHHKLNLLALETGYQEGARRLQRAGRTKGVLA